MRVVDQIAEILGNPEFATNGVAEEVRDIVSALARLERMYEGSDEEGCRTCRVQRNGERLMTTKTQPIGYALWFGDEAIPYRFTVLFCKTCGEQHPRVDEMDELLDLAGDTFACENCGTEVR